MEKLFLWRKAWLARVATICVALATTGTSLATVGDSQADEPAAGAKIVHPVDRAIMVYVPAGEFIMGMDAEESDRVAKALGYKDYHQIAAEEWAPRRKVVLSGYFIDQFEVTVEQWRRFASEDKSFKPDPQQPKEPIAENQDDFAVYPATRVFWGEAQKYANWAGKALPTEAQWEKAARGVDGRWFPWGNELPTDVHGVFVRLKDDTPTTFNMVGSKPAGVSPFGCLDMAGNVYEWTSEWHEPYPNAPERERMLAYMGHQNGCLRGGSFYHARHAFVCSKRFGFRPDESYFHVGFRTVWTPPEDYFASSAYQTARAAVAAREAELAALRKRGAKTPPTSF